ncbi:hypothetical protein [Gulosibacter sediminis]|uniref:hypothetical protein n=1 Tax=Gulosibacter sediminis TaxID=1729695 RepID=UPI0024A81A6B|nr:hypothetical protein [Gulosibacter sediminis]
METQQLKTPGGARLAWATTAGAPRREIARSLLRGLLAPDFGDIAFTQACAVCGSREHGPLRVIASTRERIPRVSVSYAAGVAVAAVAPIGVAEFGIDAEADSPRTRAAIAEALPDCPDSSIRAWTALESVAKAKGTGLRGDWQRADTAGYDLEHVTLPTVPDAAETDSWPIVVALCARWTVATRR